MDQGSTLDSVQELETLIAEREGSWGNSIRDWVQRHTLCGNSPLDLVLARGMNRKLDDRLRDALKDYAARDNIRRVHLCNANTELLSSIVSSRVAERGETRLSSVESFRIRNEGSFFVDISPFFSRYHLPKLQSLRLDGCRISLWNLLRPHTAGLTDLDLTIGGLSPLPTLDQLFSIISNPLLRRLGLTFTPAHIIIGGDGPAEDQVPLPHLEEFYLSGNFSLVFWLLNQLELPEKMDFLRLFLYECSPSDLSQTLGPYLGDHIRRRGEFPGGGQGLLVGDGENRTFCLIAGDMSKGDDPVKMTRSTVVSAVLTSQPEEGEIRDPARLCFDLIAHIPPEQIVYLDASLPILRSESLRVGMCNLTHLRLIDVDLSTWFAEPDIRGPGAFEDVLRSLDLIDILKPTLSRGWSPLTAFLSDRAANGNRISRLRIINHPHMAKDVVESIKCAVGVFEDGDKDGH